MSLRALLNAIQICQKQRKLQLTFPNLNRSWFRSLSLSTFQCSNKEESPTKVENAEFSPENKRQNPKENYDYYKKVVHMLSELDKNTDIKLKSSKMIENDCHSSSVISSLPDAVKDNLMAFPIKDHSLKTETWHTNPDNGKSKSPDCSLSENANTVETAISDGSREISRPFLEWDKMSINKDASDVILPSESADSLLEMSRRRYTEIATSYSLAVYINESETLKQLLSLGVDLSVIEKVRGAANLIIKLDFETDVKPYLLFLKDTGIPDSALAKVITKNPLIFNVSIDDLQVVIDYFKSKNFSEADIPQIVIRAPRLFLMPVSRIDGKLGFYQKFFQLNGSQVRETISRLPKLITYDVKAIKDIHFQMKEFLGFTNSDLKNIFLTSPRVFLSNKYILTKVFDYLHNEMGLSHAQLMLWPNIFRTRLHRIKERHEFLKHLKQDQYDLDKENFVSLKTLVSDDDKTFCLNVAKSSTAEYNQFLKTL